jgi:tyrosine aminotransferase
VIANGASGALDIVIGAIANEHDNILIPTPGFSLYETLCGNRGIEGRFYRLDPSKDWETDIEHMTSLIDERTRAIIVNNPSNPCGSVYSKQHLKV